MMRSSGLGNSWLSAFAAAILLIVFAASSLAVLLRVALPQVSAAERYLPLSNGVAQIYRVVDGRGGTSYVSRNAARLPTNAFRLVDLQVFAQLIEAAGIQSLDDHAAALDALNKLTVARLTQTTFDASGVFTPTVLLLLVEPQRLRQISIGQLVLSPPLTLYDVQDEIGMRHTVTGTLTTGATFEIGMTLEAREGTDTPLGHFDDCLRVLEDYDFGAGRSEARLWFCAGVGLAREEDSSPGQPDYLKVELIGANTPALVKSISPNASSRNTQTPVNSGLRRDDALPPILESNVNVELTTVFTNDVGSRLISLWEHKEEFESGGITTSPLPIEDLLLYGTGSGELVALDRGSQQARWRFQTGGAIYGAPIIANGVVYFGSADRKLYAVNLINGAFLWAFRAQDVISASPSAAQGMVFFASEDRNVYALDARTGELRWKFEAGAPVATQPMTSDGAVYFGADDGVVYALDAASGKLKWAFATNDAVTANVIVEDGVVYAGSHDKFVYALKANAAEETGETLWSTDVRDDVESAVVVANGRVYVGAGDEVRALDAASGALLWRYATAQSRYGGLLLMGNTLLFPRSHDIVALDARTGAELSITPIADATINTSLSSNGREIYIPHFDGLLKVFGGSRP